MPDLDAAAAADELLGMTTLFRATMERRHERPAGEPTRLQQFLLSSIHHRDGVTLSDLAPLLDVSAATASQMVGTLETRGWVGRGFDPADRRRHVIRLTAEGEQVVLRTQDRRRARLMRVLDQLSGEERWELVRLAQRVAGLVMATGGDFGDNDGERGGGA